MACRGGRTGTRPVRQSVALAGCGSTAGLGRCRRRRCNSVGPAGASAGGAGPGPQGRRCRVRRGSGRFCRAIGLRGAALPGEGVAVPAEQGEAAPQFALFARLFVAVPLRAGFASVQVVGVGVFVETTAQRVVAVGQRPTAAVVDVGQLASGVVGVGAFEQGGSVVAAD